MKSNEIKEKIIRENSKILHIPPEAYARIVKLSFEHSNQDVLDLGKAIESASYDGIKEIAHRLKGVYANFRITDISTRVHEIDELAKSRGDIQEIRENYIVLKDVFENFREIFNS